MLCIMYGAVQKVSKSLLRRYTLPKFQTLAKLIKVYKIDNQ